MNVKLTPEVTAAHRNLSDLCEKFEVSVDEFCASPPQSLRTQDFYESECVPIAVECKDALSKFQSACSYEVTAYEVGIAAADDALRKQKRELEADAAQRVETYKAEIAATDDALRERKRKLGADAAQRAETYEAEIAATDDALRKQKRELETDAAQRAEIYEAEIAAADDALRKQKRELEESATQNILSRRVQVEDFSDIAKLVGVHLSHFTDINPKEFLGKTKGSNNFKTSYQEALKEASRARQPSRYWLLMRNTARILLLGIFTWWIPTLISVRWLGMRNYLSEFIGSNRASFIIIYVCAIILDIVLWTFANGNKERINSASSALSALCSAAEEECYLIGKKMQNEVMKISAARDKVVEDVQARQKTENKQSVDLAAQALAVHDKKVNEADAKKETEDKQAAELATQALAAHHKRVEDARSQRDHKDKQAVELAANALATYDKRVEDVRSRRYQIMAYIKQEYQAFDTRLCQYLNKFQGLVDTWTTKNVNVTSILGENQVQNIGNNDVRICSPLTRVGTLNVWNLSGKRSRIGQHDAETVKSYPRSMRRATADQDSIETVKSYLQTIVNADTTIQPVRRARMEQDDVEVVKSYLQVIVNIEGQTSNEAQKNLDRMAKQGHLDAQYTLGNMYYSGQGVEQNYDEAVGWYRKAAEQGHVEAQWELSKLYERGSRGVKRNYVEAAKWCEKASEQGHKQATEVFYVLSHLKAAESGSSIAQYTLGNMYYVGQGVQKDDAEAAKWYRKAAEQDHVEAQRKLGNMYYAGAGVQKDDAEAAKWYQKVAEQGDADAQYRVGKMYEDGIGVQKDYTEAAKWYQKVAEQGDADAQYKLGKMYENGIGVQKDYTEAAKWYRKAAEHGNSSAKESLAVLESRIAAEQGDADAQYKLGKMYENGQRVSQSNYTAERWYKEAAEQGHTEAFKYLLMGKNAYFFDIYEQAELCQKSLKNGNVDALKYLHKMAESYVPFMYTIGMIYEKGQGVSQSDYLAMEWYEKAAEQGHAPAQYKLGEMYYAQWDTVDEEKSFEWYEKAAEQGHAPAQYKLGEMYEQGEYDHGGMFGCPGPNTPNGNRWAVESYQKAAEQEHVDAQYKLGEIYENGTHKGVRRNHREALKWYRKAAEQEHNGAKEALLRIEQGD